MVGTDLEVGHSPLSWRLGSVAQALLAVAAVVGAVWLVVLAVGGLVVGSDPPTSWWHEVTLPIVLLVVGVVGGLLLAGFGRSVGRTEAGLRRTRAESRLRTDIETVADRLVVEPVEAELGRHEAARDALTRATGETP